MEHPIPRDDLLELEDRLLDEGFGFLLSILPRELFQLCNDRIIIHEDLYHLHTGRESPIYAYFGKRENAHEDVQNPGCSYVELIRIDEAEIATMRKVPPLSWYGTQDSDYVRSPEFRDHTVALIKYYLLVWASGNNYNAPLPQPNYKHLVAAFGRLMTTHHYHNKEVIHEDEDRTDVQKSFRYLTGSQSGDEIEPSTVDLEQNDAEAGHSARTSREMLKINQKHGSSEELIVTRLPTPHQSPKDSTLDVNMVDVAEDSTRAASVASADDSAAGAELAAIEPLDTDVVMTLASEELARQSLPTPDTLMEETVVETDPTLRDLQKKLGLDALSLLPKLKACTFRKIHTEEPGFLSLRLLLGTLHDTPKSELDGTELWASFKMHDKNDRAAPRMHVHAFGTDTDDVIGDDLKIKDILPYLKPGPAFNSIAPGGDRAEELLLKALVKYYFIIAARDKLLGFDKHRMPYNDSFADQLKIAVKRLQPQDPSRDDQQIQRRPYKRLKRSYDPTPTAALSDADDDVLSFPRTRDARRSGRRTGQPSSTAVSESEDNAAPPPPSMPLPIPRRLALGVPIVPGMEAPAVNEFLDPDVDPADSDGDSGDEIPGPISADASAFLQKRYYFQKQSKAHYEATKNYAKRKEGAVMGIRKVKGMLNKHEYTTEARSKAERDLANRHLILQAMQTHLAIREQGVAGWKKRVKEVEAQTLSISPKVMETWHALYRKDEY